MIAAKPLTLVGPATLNGGGSGPVLTVNAFGLDVGLKSLTIKNGDSRFAGGIFNDGSNLSISQSSVSDNSGANIGGILNNFGTMTLTATIVSNNTGGGIANASFFGSSFPTLNLNNSTVTGNSASAYGGIFNGGELTMTNSRVTHNSAS